MIESSQPRGSGTPQPEGEASGQQPVGSKSAPKNAQSKQPAAKPKSAAKSTAKSGSSPAAKKKASGTGSSSKASKAASEFAAPGERTTAAPTREAQSVDPALVHGQSSPEDSAGAEAASNGSEATPPSAPEAPQTARAETGKPVRPWARPGQRGLPRIPTEEEQKVKAAHVAAVEAKEAEHDEPDPELARRPVPSEDELMAALEWAFQGDEVLPGVLAAYAKHARLVLEANRQLNLTSIVDAKEVAVKHYLDSWRATRLMPLMGKRVMDLGSGAGFPGMPAALCEPNCQVTLVETRRKKADFMAESIAAMGLKNARAVWARGEDYLTTERCDVVFIRALSSVRENVRMLRKVRHSFLDLVLFKGPSWSREVRASERETERLGFRLDTVWEHELPGGMGQRALLVYRSPASH